METDCQAKRGFRRDMERLSQMCPEQRDPDKECQ